jgi:hypothetical protein
MQFQPKHTGEIIEDGWYVLVHDDDEILAGPYDDSREAYEHAEGFESNGQPADHVFLLVADILAQQAADDYADIDWTR